MKFLLRLSALCALSSVLGFLSGCNLPSPQADTVRHFTLSGPASAPPVANATQVRPVQLAGHLHGRAMAVRVAEQEVIYLEDVRWAEPLDEAITQLLRTRLGAVGSGATVTVQVQRCELVRFAGDSVQLAATYSILSADGDKLAPQRGAFTASPRTWDGKDYGALVGQLRDAVGELGDAIAAAVATPTLPSKK
ncbi:MAG TPA: ABC-type transport auxiliary lipoprotein family protein [Lacunisphaera sp.]|nr:ABC-type transport auxiliary lipoprotein family protein [Lacunisphaera sp.]